MTCKFLLCTGCPFNLANFQIAVTLLLFGIFPISKKFEQSKYKRFVVYNSNTKNCANSVISLEPFSNIVFSKEAIIWIVQNYFSDKKFTQLRRYYIVNFTITNKKTALVVKAFKSPDLNPLDFYFWDVA